MPAGGSQLRQKGRQATCPRSSIPPRVRIGKGPLRRAYIEQFGTPLRFGVHTNIKDFYGIEAEEELPATLDHIVASVGG